MTRHFTIRPASQNDRSEINSLLVRSYAALMPQAYTKSKLDEVLPIIGKANTSLLSTGRYYVALDSKCLLVGAGGWSKEAPANGTLRTEVGHLRHFATDPACVGQGIGTAIFDQCVADARAAGLTGFSVFASLNAQGFYERLGFQVIRTVFLDLAPVDTFEAVEMWRPIRQ